MKLLAMVTEPKSITRYLAKTGEPTSVPAPSPNRGPPYWKSSVLRRRAGGDGQVAGGGNIERGERRRVGAARSPKTD